MKMQASSKYVLGLLFMCMSVYMYLPCVLRLEDSFRSLSAGVTKICELPTVGVEPNVGLLQKWQVLLTIDSLAP